MPVKLEQCVMLYWLIPQIVLQVFKVILLEILSHTSLRSKGFVAHSCFLREVAIADNLYLDLCKAKAYSALVD